MAGFDIVTLNIDVNDPTLEGVKAFIEATLSSPLYETVSPFREAAPHTRVTLATGAGSIELVATKGSTGVSPSGALYTLKRTYSVAGQLVTYETSFELDIANGSEQNLSALVQPASTTVTYGVSSVVGGDDIEVETVGGVATVSFTGDAGGVTDHGALTGLSDNDHAGVYDLAGTAASAVSTHAGLADPHAVYALESALGNASTRNVGTSAGTVAAGDDSRIVGAVRPPRKSTYYYTPDGVLGSTAAGLNDFRAVPILFGNSVTLDRIGISVAVGVATALFRMGLYADDGTGFPGALILDAGTVDASVSSTEKEIVISQALAPGLYWLAGVAQTASFTVRTITSTSLAIVGFSTSPGASAQNVAYRYTGITGALPNPFGASGTFQGPANPGYRVYVRVA